MQVFHSLADAAHGPLKGAALCLGNFDGVHQGHRALLAEAARHASPAALTFQPHPGKVLQPDLAPRLITLTPRKLELLEEAGVAATVVQPFTLEYAKTAPEAFEASLFDELEVGHVVVGADFSYGAKRVGTVARLSAEAAKRGRRVHVVAPVTVDGVVVSSSKIREYILEGRVEAAALLLGRPFDLDGLVVQGAGRGRTIGFPTANVDTANELKPASGVYAVQVKDGDVWRGGAANIGTKPTFGGGAVTIEVHVLDWSGDLYGKKLRVRFVARLRAERRFASAAELSGQIARDVEAARAAVART